MSDLVESLLDKVRKVDDSYVGYLRAFARGGGVDLTDYQAVAKELVDQHREHVPGTVDDSSGDEGGGQRVTKTTTRRSARTREAEAHVINIWPTQDTARYGKLPQSYRRFGFPYLGCRLNAVLAFGEQNAHGF